MKIYIPKIQPKELQERELNTFHSLSSEKYGEDLARKVAAKLSLMPSREKNNYLTSDGLFHSHRDYCGTGLYFFEDKFVLGEVNDGMGPYPIMATFEGEDEFVTWLANQSDQSMSLIVAVKDNSTSFKFNNQTITKIRLEYFLEEEYSPVWNTYCAYLTKRTELQ